MPDQRLQMENVWSEVKFKPWIKVPCHPPGESVGQTIHPNRGQKSGKIPFLDTPTSDYGICLPPTPIQSNPMKETSPSKLWYCSWQLRKWPDWPAGPMHHFTLGSWLSAVIWSRRPNRKWNLQSISFFLSLFIYGSPQSFQYEILRC